MNSNNPLLSRFADQPVLIEPSQVQRLELDLNAIMSVPRVGELLTRQQLAADENDGFWFAPDDWRSAYRPYVVRNGVLLIPVKGVLLNDFPWSFGSWATGYQYISRAVDRGLADGNVRRIALLVDSYGGQGAGCFDCSERVAAGRSIKPIEAYAETAYSAGYAIACAGARITAAKGAGIGSIGVVMTHLDVSRAMDQAGLKVTFIFSGKHKVDGNAYQALPDDVRARWQAWCDEQRTDFCALVASNRDGRISAEQASATEAQCYRANEAIELNLIDAIAPLDDAVTAFCDPQQSDASDDDEGESGMSGSVPTAGAAAAAAASTAALDTARAEGHAAGLAAGKTEGKAEGVKEGTTAERTRISAILGSDEAKGRTSMAQHLAFETEMTADAAKALLAKAPAEAKAEAANPLAAAMSQVKNPDVGADTNADNQSDDAKATALASSIVAAYRGPKAA